MEGTIELLIDNPTAGATDGTPVSQSTQSYPVNVIINAAEANYAIVKAALRCTAGFESSGDVQISFSGGTTRFWGVADDDSYVDAEAAALADYDSTLTLQNIGDTNHIIWFKVSTDGTESSVVDTSVKINLYGRVVPT